MMYLQDPPGERIHNGFIGLVLPWPWESQLPSQLEFALFLGMGWLVFGYAPDALSLLGMGIIAGSGLLIAFKSKLAR